jgi:hypothetical protein
MNMKILAVIGISGAVMLGSVYSITANTSGYDLYKDALKKTQQLESTTMEISMDLLDVLLLLLYLGLKLPLGVKFFS